jgi:hypothetical protein
MGHEVGIHRVESASRGVDSDEVVLWRPDFDRRHELMFSVHGRIVAEGMGQMLSMSKKMLRRAL